LRVSDKFGRGLAGRPLFVRYVDDRKPDAPAVAPAR
jgi:hypothetical protein